MGLKLGLIRAGFTASGTLVGSVLGGELSAEVGRIVSAIDSDGAIIITICLIIAAIASVIVRKVLTILLIGWADTLAGGTLGIAAGAVVSAAMIMGMANLTYSSEVGDEISNKVLNSTLDSESPRSG